MVLKTNILLENRKGIVLEILEHLPYSTLSVIELKRIRGICEDELAHVNLVLIIYTQKPPLKTHADNHAGLEI